ncbi:MAG: MFS transporter [Candidatus Hodarchaeota archaeon]
MSNRKSYSTAIHTSYGMGGFLDNFLTAAFTIRVIGFYEDEILLPIILIGVAYILYGIWNMFNDPITGYLSDRKTRFITRWGRRYPWFVIAFAPYTLFYLLIFTVPSSDTIIAFFWLLFTICMFDLFYSLWMTNWLALFPDKFRSIEERTKVGGFSTLLGQVGLTFGMLIPPIFIDYGNIGSYAISGVVVLVIGLISGFLMIPGMREDKQLRERAIKTIDDEKESESFFKVLKFAIRQKNFVAYVFVYLAQMMLFMLVLGSVQYWVRYILKEKELIEMVISAAFLVGSVISVPIWVYLGRKLGNRKVYMYGSISPAIVFISFFFISNVIGTIIGTVLLGITIGAIWTLMYPTFSDVIDEIVVKTGTRQEGIYTGIRTFFGRASNILGAIVFATVHMVTKYTPGEIDQSGFALFGIRAIMALVPMIFYFISFLLMWKVYDLKPDKVQVIKEELNRLNL